MHDLYRCNNCPSIQLTIKWQPNHTAAMYCGFCSQIWCHLFFMNSCFNSWMEIVNCTRTIAYKTSKMLCKNVKQTVYEIILDVIKTMDFFHLRACQKSTFFKLCAFDVFGMGTRCWLEWLTDWLIDWIAFYVLSAIFQPCNGGWLECVRSTTSIKYHYTCTSIMKIMIPNRQYTAEINSIRRKTLKKQSINQQWFRPLLSLTHSDIRKISHIKYKI